MVRLPTLITEYAKLDGRPRSTIAWYARLAREAGKIPTTKRGLGASHMGVREAVNLILACNGTDHPKEGANAIEKFRSYVPFRLGVVGGKEDLDEIEDSNMREIGLEPSFGQALEKLIRLTPHLFKTFDESLSRTHPKMRITDRFHIIKGNTCVNLEKGNVCILIGSQIFTRYDKNLPNKNILRLNYYEEFKNISVIDNPTAFANLRETDVSLRFGIFMGLAKLFFEDSMQFPDELIPQSIGGGRDA